MNHETALDDIAWLTSKFDRAQTEAEICSVTIDAVPRLFDTDIAGVWLYESSGENLQYADATERAQEVFGTDIVYQPGNSRSWRAFESGEIHLYPQDEMVKEVEPYNENSDIEGEILIPVGDYGIINVASFDSVFCEVCRKCGEILASQVEAALSQLYRRHELQLENERIKDLMSTMSHDICSPLQVCTGFLSSVQNDYQDERLQKIDEGLTRIQELVDESLELAEQDSVIMGRSKINLEELVNLAWSNVYTPDAEIQVDSTIDLYADKNRLLQVFENLISNSIEHSQGSVSIRVGPIQPIPTNTRATTGEFEEGFYFEDDGPGIEDGNHENIFSPNYTTSGSGLGLAIVERIITAHGWDITVTNSSNGGTRFQITGETTSVMPLFNK